MLSCVVDYIVIAMFEVDGDKAIEGREVEELTLLQLRLIHSLIVITHDLTYNRIVHLARL